MLKNSRLYMASASLLAVINMLGKSLYLNFTGRNTRDATDKLARSFSHELLSAVNATVTLKGQIPHLVPGRSYILISNHASHIDIPAIYAAVPLSIRMIAKEELYNIPIFGAAMKRHEFIKINRQHREKAFEALQETRKLMESGIVIWAAAEGTRTRTGKLLPFKKGLFMLAIDAQAIVIPTTIQGTFDILPADTWHFSSGHPITVTLGSPIDTQGMTAASRDKLMADVRAQMEIQLKGSGHVESP